MNKDDIPHEKLRQSISSDLKKHQNFEREKQSVLAQSVFLGTIGVVIVTPIVAGAYFGLWLDDQYKTFSFSWTISFIIIGVVVGVFNAIYFVKEH